MNPPIVDIVPATPLRLLLADDHAVMRAGLANMLGVRPEFEVVAQADDGDTALQLHRQHRPDVTLLDVMMPGMTGIECLRAIQDEFPEARILMLTSSHLENDVHQAIGGGASGYVTKNASPAELVNAILAVGRGERAIDPELVHAVDSKLQPPPLTPRELQVLGMLRLGNSNPEIGRELGITPRTAKAHVAAILVKLGAQDRTEAVTRGFERGLLRL